MKLSLPGRVPMKPVFAFCVALCLVELAEGTELLVAILVFAYFLLYAWNFNLAGGLRTPSGSYVFWGVGLTGALGLVVKAGLGEAVGSRLIDARFTMLVYCATLLTMLPATAAARRLRLKRPLLGNILQPARAQRAAAGCILIAIALPLVLSGAATTAFNQINRLVTLGCLLSIYYRTRETDGRTSVSAVGVAGSLYIFYLSLYSFSKEGLFLPFAAWAIAAVAGGWRLSVTQMTALAGTFVLYASIITPYSQVGRNLKNEVADPTDAVVQLLSHPLQTRAEYQRQEQYQVEHAKIYYSFYDRPEGLLDRLTMLALDDALIARTNTGYFAAGGMYQLVQSWENVIPRVLWPDKPNLYFGNEYAHELGILNRDDVTTAVSFGFSADAYHMGGWPVVLLIGPLFFFFPLFWVADSVAGSLDQSPWPLLYCVIFAHTAPEGGIGWTVYGLSVATFGVIVVAYTASYIAPMLGTAVMGPERVPLQAPPLRPVTATPRL